MSASNIVSRRISDLIPDPKNARIHNAKNLDAITASLSQFGQQKPIVVDSNGVIVAGNGTWEAARDLGWVNIDTVLFTGTSEQATAYAIADNRASELGEWDVQRLLDTLGSIDDDLRAYVGWDDDDLAKFLTPPRETPVAVASVTLHMDSETLSKWENVVETIGIRDAISLSATIVGYLYANRSEIVNNDY